MTFNDRVARRWRVSTLFTIIGFLVMLVLTGTIVIFTIFVAVPLDENARKIISAVFLFCVASAFFIGWGFRSSYISTIDTLIRNMGRLQKKMLMAAIKEDLSGEEAESDE